MAIDEPKRKSLFGEWGIYQTYAMREKKRKQEEELEPFLRPLRVTSFLASITLLYVASAVGSAGRQSVNSQTTRREQSEANSRDDWVRDYLPIGGMAAIWVIADVSGRTLRKRLLARFAQTKDSGAGADS